MDFIARAGSVIQRANAVAGLLLLLLIALGFFTLNVMGQNADLKRSIAAYSQNQKVYVVPGSTAGMYAPRRLDFLLESFVDHVSQSLLTYTYASLEKQYIEIRKFFTPKLMERANIEYAKTIKISRTDERSALFIPDRSTYKTERVPHPTQKGKFVKGVRRVSMVGTRQYLLGGESVEATKVLVQMEVREAAISQANPFGFVVTDYADRQLSVRELDQRGEL